MSVAICGWIGSGKDSIADALVTDHGFKRLSLAASLKDAVASIFGWERKLLEGDTHDGRVWRETVDNWWSNRLAIPNLTPRLMLQLWGTEIGRDRFHSDIWVASLENQLRQTSDNVVITDCRFPNEIAAMRRVGATMVWVKRGALPDWYSTAILANRGDTAAQDALTQMGIHKSETSWVGAAFDFEINNNGTLADLKIEATALGHLASKAICSCKSQ